MQHIKYINKIKNLNFEDLKDRHLNQKISITKLAKEIGITRLSLTKLFKINNIEIVNFNNQLKFNNKIFDCINEESAYWLGFLYADGNVDSFKNDIELSLKLSDFSHLEKFKNFLKTPKIVKLNYNRCRLIITDKYLKNKLIQLGCYPKKSLNLKFPTIDQFDFKFINHFMRGYFDGDGSIWSKNDKLYFSLLGTKEFLESFLNNIPNLKYKKLYKDKRHLYNTYFISFSGKKANLIFNFIYKDSNIYLDRKFAVYNSNIINYERAKTKNAEMQTSC